MLGGVVWSAEPSFSRTQAFVKTVVVYASLVTVSCRVTMSFDDPDFVDFSMNQIDEYAADPRNGKNKL